MKKYYLTFMFFALLFPMTLCAQSEATYVPKIITGVVKADSWTMDNNKEGIYELEVKEGGTLTQLNEGRDVYLAPLGGAAYYDGKMHGIHFRTIEDPYTEAGFSYVIYHVEYEMETWTQTKRKALSDMYGNLISSCGIAHDPTTGLNYGIMYNFDMNYNVLGTRLCTIDYSTDTPTKTIIADIFTPFAAITCNASGYIYGVGRDGWLYIIDKDGMLYPLGDLGISNISSNPSSLTIDPKTDKMYWSYVSTQGKSYLYEINPTIGSVSAQMVMQVPDNAYLVNMYIAPPQATDAAPAAVSNLQALFEGSSLTGTVSFTAPTTTYLGDALAGALNYTIKANGNEVATGETEAGAACNVEVTVEPGDNEIVVTVENAFGISPEAKVSMYVGPETPKAPTAVLFNYDYETHSVLLSWEAPTTGIHEQALDIDELTYRIERSDGTVVEEGVTGTTWSETFDPSTLAAYTYSVSATNTGMTGEAAMSNKAVIGPALNVPYSQNFATSSSFDLLSVLDMNNDGATWKWDKGFSSNRAMYYCTTGMAGDDWLLSPPLQLEKGATYKFKMTACEYTGANYDFFSVGYGRDLKVGAYEEVIGETTLITPVDTDYEKDNIVPEESGVYYFGIHITSPEGQGALLLKYFSIVKTKDAPQPDGIETIMAEKDGMIEIYTLTGEKVYQGYSMPQLKRGMYVIRGKGEGKVIVKSEE